MADGPDLWILGCKLTDIERLQRSLTWQIQNSMLHANGNNHFSILSLPGFHGRNLWPMSNLLQLQDCLNAACPPGPLVALEREDGHH